jgi:hypothetical protein
MKEYFKIIRQAISQERKKSEGVYYEAHHIIPKSFGKKSTTVLLTPEEHFTVHKLLAEYWKSHTVYGKKMLWAFHRISYDGKRHLTKEDYGEARKILQTLWKSDKSVLHKEKISIALKGNTNNSSRVFKGMQSSMTQKGRASISESRKKDQTGKTGLLAKAAKGPYTVIFETGESYTAGSYSELVKLTGISLGTLQHRLTHKEGLFLKKWSIRKGE